MQRASDNPGQRHAAGAEAGPETAGAVGIEEVGVRDFLHGEFHVGQLGFPAWFQPGDGLEYQVIELLRTRTVQRYLWRDQSPAQPAPVPVPPPGGPWGTGRTRRHSYRAYRRTERAQHAKHDTFWEVVALPP